MDGDEVIEVLGRKNRVEDIRWLCSLSGSELDLMMSLKTLVLKHAKVIGREELAEKFDLRMLRALGLVLMEYLKGKLEGLSHIPGLSNSASSLNAYSLLKSNVGETLSIEELMTCIGLDDKKRPAKRPREESPLNTKEVED